MRLPTAICVFFLLLVGPLKAEEFSAQGKVGLISLSDGHCMPCKMMSGLVDKMQKEYKDDLVGQTLYPLKDKAVAEKYAPKTLPTLVFFNRQGQEVFRHAGIMEEADMRALIDKLLKE